MQLIWWFCLPLVFKVCPQTLAQRPPLDSPTQVQACTHQTHFLPWLLSLSPSFTPVYFFTHKCAGKWVYQRSLGWGAKKHPMLSLSSNLNVIMQMDFAWSMQQCGHLESTLTVISYTRSQPFMSAANVYGCWTVSKYESAFICIPHTHPWKLAFIKVKEMSGGKCICYFSANLQSSCHFFKLDIGMGTQLSDVTVQSSCV